MSQELFHGVLLFNTKQKDYLSYFYPHTTQESTNKHIWNDRELYRMKILENLKGILVAADAANEDLLHSQTQQVILHYNHDYPVLIPKVVEDDRSKAIQQSILAQQNLLVSYQHLKHSHLIFVLILPLLSEQDVLNPQQNILKELLDFLQFQLSKDWTTKLETIHRTLAKQLDEIFDSFFNIYFFKSTSWRHALFLFYNATHMLKLPIEMNQAISEELTALEASSNSSNEEFHNCPRPSFIMGTCLFYNGSILVSHLSQYTAKQITKYILCHSNIMQRTKQSAEEILVVSVFLESKQNQLEEYTMVLYCQQQFILVSILKFMSTVSGQRNVYYVEEMQSTIQRILSKELELQIEKSIANEVIVTDLSMLLQSKKSGIKPYSNSPRTITVGTNSNLLHYFTFYSNKGLFVSPLEVCHSKVEQLFVKYIKMIRHVLLKTRNYEEQKVIEYGIKMNESEMIPNQTLSLWIVGYMNPTTQPPTEVYVCYEDGNLLQAQRVCDLAHKLL